MMTSRLYWKQRTQRDEEHAARLAANYSKRQQAAYRRAYHNIERELNAIFADMESGKVKRTMIWNYYRYQKLLDIIAAECQSIGGYQISLLDGLAAELFAEVIGTKFAEFGKQDLFQALDIEGLMRQVLNAEWSGQSYSSRVWHNTNQLAVELEKQIEAMMATGKNPEQIKGELKRRFNASYYVSDRLIRTESSYIYNSAALESYKRAGVNQVEFLAEPDCCDLCAAHRNKKFSIDDLPFVPVHPNCRCTYIPLVD